MDAGIFYRPAGCIPENFNLLSFFDPPRVFGCGPMTVEAFAIWENGPGLDPAPRQGRPRGLGAVPIWFVRTEDYVAASADGVVTIGELEALDPLMGLPTASPRRFIRGANNSLLVINATENCRTAALRLHITLQEAKGHRLDPGGISTTDPG